MPDSTKAHANLGREFEQMLERSHEVYADRGLAQIKKHPVEWKYTSFEAFRQLSTHRQDLVAKTNTDRYIARIRSYVDFSGVAKGRFIAFDAKQVSRYNFPLVDLRSHQLTRLVSSEQCGGIAGLMIRFTSYQRIFFVPAAYVDQVNNAMADGGKKSISIDDCVAHGTEIHRAPGIEVDWHRALIKGGK
ncbi:MAG TPA: Holliday junction resolvase RecU [Pyrinomonadaceae bacterium]|jgi:recombination protein U|nr:Holliday junction resolvase RecU [Pyrinomonadaceae bacterium]